MNLPNKLTIVRVLLVPIMVIVPMLGIQGEWFNIPIDFCIVNIIFVIASITDKLDGSIARSKNQVTNFGKFLDPIADKILVLAAMLILVENGNIPAWIPIIILAREFIVSAYRLIAMEQGGQVIAASNWGKLKTVTQMIAIIGAFLNINGSNVFFAFTSGNLTGIELFVNVVTSVMMLIATIATIISGWEYIKNGKDLLLKDK